MRAFHADALPVVILKLNVASVDVVLMYTGDDIRRLAEATAAACGAAVKAVPIKRPLGRGPLSCPGDMVVGTTETLWANADPNHARKIKA